MSFANPTRLINTLRARLRLHFAVMVLALLLFMVLLYVILSRSLQDRSSRRRPGSPRCLRRSPALLVVDGPMFRLRLRCASVQPVGEKAVQPRLAGHVIVLWSERLVAHVRVVASEARDFLNQMALCVRSSAPDSTDPIIRRDGRVCPRHDGCRLRPCVRLAVQRRAAANRGASTRSSTRCLVWRSR
jgi:hypothetical protein